MAGQPKLPSHASPVFAPVAQAQHVKYDWSSLSDSNAATSSTTSTTTPTTPPTTATTAVPGDLLSPVPTPPATPGNSTPHHLLTEPRSVPVDTAAEDAASTSAGTTVKKPQLVGRLPVVECVVRARIPTTSGTEMWLHLYQNDSDNKEHLAIVFGNSIRSRSLDAEKPGETEMDRMIRGAYVGRLTPGRTSSRIDPAARPPQPRRKTRTRTGSSALKHVETAATSTRSTEQQQQQQQQEEPKEADNEVEDDNDDDDEETDTPLVKAPLVRIHSECYTGETAWSARCDCGEQLDEAARLMSLPSASASGGVIVYLRQEGRGIGLASKLKAYNLQDLGNDTVEANLLLRHPADARTYGLATAILCDLGLGTDGGGSGGGVGIRLLTNNPDKVRAVEGPAQQVRVTERVAMVPIAWRTGGARGVRGAEIEKYLDTKIRQMGHMIHD